MYKTNKGVLQKYINHLQTKQCIQNKEMNQYFRNIIYKLYIIKQISKITKTKNNYCNNKLTVKKKYYQVEGKNVINIKKLKKTNIESKV